MLSPYRVLDLTTERGLLCGQILADLGADVIQIEPPGGSPARRIGPFYEDLPDPDRSLYWWAYSRNKRAVTLDITKDEGRELLIKLARSADFLVESYNPGYLASLGLGYDDLSAMNPALVYVSISPFGQDGPKAGYADSDLVVMAAGGPLVLSGDEDRAPVRVSVPQAYLHAATDAAVGAMVALHERIRSGLGQHVDVSAQQSLAIATQSGILAAPFETDQGLRMSGGVKLGHVKVRLVWPAKDGWVSLAFLFGSALGVFTKKLMHYLCEHGWCDEATRDKDWLKYGEMLLDGTEPLKEFDRVQGLVSAFTAAHTKEELLRLALEKGFLFAPITTVEEVVNSEQFHARDYFQECEHPELGRSIRYPGPFVKFSESPIAYRRRPPAVGEHNRAVYLDEMGMTESELDEHTRKGII